MLNLYTFILEFLGGTFIYQIKGVSPEDAMLNWVNKLNLEEIGAKDYTVKDIINDIKLLEKKPNNIEDVKNVWCIGFEINDEYALTHIIKTSE